MNLQTELNEIIKSYCYKDFYNDDIEDGFEYRFRDTAEPEMLQQDILKLFREDFKSICDEYDNQYGRYPESEYEGKSLYRFWEEEILSKI